MPLFFRVLITALLLSMGCFASPVLDDDFGMNTQIIAILDANKSDEFPLNKSMTTLSKTKVQLQQEQYGKDIQHDSDILAQKYEIWGKMARSFTIAIQKYTQALDFVQVYPRETIRRWNLPPQFDVAVDPHDQGKLVLSFSEPLYLGF